ncbi:MAG: zinc-binding dehydrogenase [Imperialibacter sp.]|uniref:zinc-binding dehydrogenase n=1 Tax=Imperialibacter sp. TaxID=2038411 RepID=UPI0032ED3C15
MKALKLVNETADHVKLVDMPEPTPGKGEVLIKMQAAALNHRDQWCREGKYPNIKFDVVLGSDGCGVVEQLGPDTDETWKGKSVIINPNINWGSNPEVQSAQYRILGMPDNGTLSEYVVVPVDRLFEKPTHLTPEQASALPLCGLTAYRALFTRGKLKRGQNVLVSGAGGGVAVYALMFAKLAGANVYVTSGSKSKITQAVALGAVEGFDYNNEKWAQTALKSSGGFDLIVDSTGGQMINQYLRVLKHGGRVVIYGASSGIPKTLDVFRIFWNQLTIQGSTMGNDQEFEQMIDYVNRTQMLPVIDSVRPFSEVVTAFDKMKQRKQFGKLVVTF